MKKVIVGLLCFMLTAGLVSGCQSKEPKPDEDKKETVENSADKDKVNTEAVQTEEKDKKEPETDKEKDKDKEEKKEEADKENMADDLTMKVLKEGAGTIDYTSLEELNPEPGTHIAVVVKTPKRGYWVAVKKGMDAAVKDLNQKMGYKGDDKIKISFEGPSEEVDIESQINIIDAVLSENPAVLCLAALDMESCGAQLEAAAENDIPVIVLDSGVESDLVNAVCATDNYAAGAEAARKLAESIEGKGKIAVMTHVGTTETSINREKGFTEEIAANYPEIEIVNISHENKETSMTEMAEAVLKLYPDVKGYFCTNELSAEEVLAAVDNVGKQMAVVGIDAGKKQRDAVKKGKEVGMIAQNPYGMGYATVIAGLRADAGLENDAFINSGYQWLDSTNIDLPEYGNYLHD